MHTENHPFYLKCFAMQMIKAIQIGTSPRAGISYFARKGLATPSALVC